ncbi:alkaline phosphatase D family protein [Flavobacteriales bacterium]|nr:alkaline phosphatase D family protein [Flavobacteriales bacterium]
MRAFILLLSSILFGFQVSAQTTLPANMFGDTAFAPFYWGVASGDPLADGVVIWTKVAAIPEPVIQTLTWEVSADESFAITTATGSVDALAMNDLCVRAEVSGLQPNSYYYYRFTDSESGQTSQVGRTKTAPIGETDEMTLAVASCSSIYSGFFNAYRSIANNDEVDLMVHLGDYIYDFVDSDEQVRVPTPTPEIPENLQEWRDLHAYYLLDPDLRLLRQMHPWVVIWDNHDFGPIGEGGAEAFWEYVPRRDYHNDVEKIHRSYTYGNLLDLIMMDVEKFRNIDEVAPGEPSILSTEQRQWLLNELSNSESKWRVLGSQKVFSGWYSEGIPEGLGLPTDGDVFDNGSWDGFMAERDTLLTHLVDNDIENVMVISGDVHMSFAMDISLDPRDPDVYNPETGSGSIGTEFIPSSISRGNLDEQGFDQETADFFEGISRNLNPHHLISNFVDHGYGLLEINHDSIVAQIRYCNKFEISDFDTLGYELVMLNGENKWKRSAEANSIAELKSENPMVVYPNPANETLNVRFIKNHQEDHFIEVFDTRGKAVFSTNSAGQEQIQLNVSKLNPGTFVLQVSNAEKVFKKSFVISR